MEFGVFDHVDRSDLPLADYYETRLRIIAAYDRLGFFGYHLAEHHATPLGMAPSPSVFMAAIAQRTQRLRFGPMVYALPLYHPIRMIEEICMLDHLSRGRIELGFGRGSSPTELAFYGQNPKEAQPVYAEAMEVLMKGLTEKTLTFHGRHFDFDGVPMELAPLQQPHPPLWYGVHAPDSAERAARAGLRVLDLDGPAAARLCFERFRATWTATRPREALPLMGISRFVVVAETDAEALALARRAYKRWRESFTFLHRRAEYAPAHPRPETFDEIAADGRAMSGSPATVLRIAREHIAEIGANYFVGQFVFGDMTEAEMLNSIELFAGRVMPELRTP
jgi:alkanesulfonate monooxygenase SsuD/methylene tetrahydromethanopterin reductase-like flavin-dependent oxidoreductase (luciferase family)